MIKCVSRTGRVRALVLACLFLVVALTSERGFAATMYVMIMPVEEKVGTAVESRDVKVCLVVHSKKVMVTSTGKSIMNCTT